jgi:hypothetical protein
MMKKALFLSLFLSLFGGKAALAYSPVQIQHTAAITVTIPEMETGDLYDDLVDKTSPFIDPFYDFVEDAYNNHIAGNDPVTMGQDIVDTKLPVLWQFFNYFDNLLPGFISLSALILFFLTVIVIKVILSILMYIWKLIPLKAS